ARVARTLFGTGPASRKATGRRGAGGSACPCRPPARGGSAGAWRCAGGVRCAKGIDLVAQGGERAPRSRGIGAALIHRVAHGTHGVFDRPVRPSRETPHGVFDAEPDVLERI